MKTQQSTAVAGNPKDGILASVLKSVAQKVSEMFEPEEVEVTFSEDNSMSGSYTYTVIPHKQVA
ncbi:MAG: hypothetical protein H7257_11800 [Taibaiella sp.]|nr:hypothetical protein [Taibaiella sp.]